MLMGTVTDQPSHTCPAYYAFVSVVLQNASWCCDVISLGEV